MTCASCFSTMLLTEPPIVPWMVMPLAEGTENWVSTAPLPGGNSVCDTVPLFT